ncbi:MAG: sigma-70 family RNA polymerase sigma factor [Planctomycetota bacterium]
MAESSKLELLQTHDAFVRAIARGLVGDAHDAEDLAQDTFVAALAGEPRAESLKSWLITVVSNLSKRAFRGERRRGEREQRSVISADVPSPEDILEREIVRRRVVEAVLQLDEHYRSVVLLRYYENLQPREIARRLQLPVETVRTRLKRAHLKLRVSLDTLYNGDRRAWCSALLPLVVIGMATKTKITIGAVAALFLVFMLWQFEIFPAGGPTEPVVPVERSIVTVPIRGSVHDTASAPRTTAESTDRNTTKTDAGPGRLRVAARWRNDDSPAANIAFTVTDWAEAGNVSFAQVYNTGADGSATVDSLPPGRRTLSIDRVESENIMIESGMETVYSVILNEGVHVSGIVYDNDRKPAPNAQIWCAKANSTASQIGGIQFGVTNQKGEFTIKGVSDDSYIWARSDRFAPSRTATIRGNDGAKRKIELVLGAEGGWVSGRVVHINNHPVPNTTVRIGSDYLTGIAGREDRSTFGARARTNANGEFTITGVAAGEHEIWARAAGLGFYRSKIKVVENNKTPVEIVLFPGAALEGIVKSEEGTPVRWAQIYITGFDHFEMSEGWTDKNGYYKISDISKGEIECLAKAQKEGEAKSKFYFSPGETARWDVTLSTGLKIRGRVVDENGDPLPGFVVDAQAQAAFSPGLQFTNHAMTAADGSFILKNCKDTIYSLRVQSAGSPEPLAKMDRIQPGSEEVVIRVPGAKSPASWIIGELNNKNGEPFDRAVVSAWRAGVGGAIPVSPDPKTGKFKLGPLPEGNYYINIEVGARKVKGLSDKITKKGETLDLGKITVDPTGSLHAKITRAGGVPLHGITAVVFAPNGQGYGEPQPAQFENTTNGGSIQSPELPPGEYYMIIESPETAIVQMPFSIIAGEQTAFEITLQKGIVQTLKFSAKAGAATFERIVISIQTAGGDSVANLFCKTENGGACEVRVALPEGELQLKARTNDGRECARAILVGSSAPAASIECVVQ